MENHRYRKNWIRKLYTRENKLTTTPKVIMRELESFYRDLYKNRVEEDENETKAFVQSANTKQLSEKNKQICEGKFIIGECFSALQKFQKNKSPGNDRLDHRILRSFLDFIGRSTGRNT